MGGKCNQRSNDSLTDDIKNDCCSQITRSVFFETAEARPTDYEDDDTSDDTLLDSHPCEKGHHCSQLCFIQGDRSHCDCTEGFELDTADNRTCRKIVDCERGYEKNSSEECEDVDECELGTHGCAVNEQCVNWPGSFVCKKKACSTGYKLDPQTGSCDDIDECKSNPCHYSNQVCVNWPGRYSCECAYGYRFDSSSRECRDINECVEHPQICDHSCYNTWGTYRCSCKRGYKLSSDDNRTCSDIDECKANSKHLCQGTCKNTIGSYKCGCQKGLVLDGGRFCKGEQN